MKETILVSWKWIAAGAAMALLTVMMATGLGSRRGTWLHGFRLSLWVAVMTMGGVSTGCSDSRGIRGHADADDTTTDNEDLVVPDLSCYVDMGAEPAPDPVADIEEEEFTCVECYQAPWDPPPDAPEDPVEDDPSDDEEDGD